METFFIVDKYLSMNSLSGVPHDLGQFWAHWKLGVYLVSKRKQKKPFPIIPPNDESPERLFLRKPYPRNIFFDKPPKTYLFN